MEQEMQRHVLEELRSATESLAACQNIIDTIRMATHIEKRVVLSEEQQAVMDQSIKNCSEIPNEVTKLLQEAHEGLRIDLVHWHASSLSQHAALAEYFMGEMKKELNLSSDVL